MRRFAALPLLLALGCSVSSLDRAAAERVSNVCEEQSECGEDGVCRDGFCQSRTSGFATLLLEVTPASMSGPYTGVAFREVAYLNYSGPDGSPLEIPLKFEDTAEPAGIVGPAPARGCTTLPNGGSIPARVTFVPTEQFLGLPSSSYTAQTTLDPTTGEYRYKLRMPPGDYDIYVEPDSELAASLIDDDACRVVPQIFRDQFVKAELLELPLLLPAPQRLSVQVNREEDGASLAGWSLEMVDHLTGRLISNQQILTEVAGESYMTELWYSPATGGAEDVPGRELLRLRPGDDQVAPTLLLQRDGLELFAAGEAIIDELKSLPPVVQVAGKVETFVRGASGPGEVAATVTLVATRMQGMEVGSASFLREIKTEPDGRFSVRLPPGDYRVYAEPERSADVVGGCGTLASELAAQEEDWTIAPLPEFQAGRIIQLQRNDVVIGQSLTPLTGEPLIGATIEAVPSACTRPPDVLRLDSVPFAPRAASGSVCSANGEFSFSADAGIYDMSIRPPEGTGWPWLVLPTTEVPGPALGALIQPLPVHYRGSVRVGPEQEPVPRALVRAFVFIDAEGNVSASPLHAAWVLAVGETRTDESGRFNLLLPSGLSAPPRAGGMGGGGCF
jgi:hypothetical protein